MANILILGGGFGGLVAAEKLAAALGARHQITLISNNRNFVFYPALVQVSFERFEPEDISFDLGKKCFDLGIRFKEGEAILINRESRSVTVAKEDYTIDTPYDFLILAPGRHFAAENIPGFFQHAHHLLDVPAALEFGEANKRFDTDD